MRETVLVLADLEIECWPLILIPCSQGLCDRRRCRLRIVQGEHGELLPQPTSAEEHQASTKHLQVARQPSAQSRPASEGG
jgi:hypothetical protein